MLRHLAFFEELAKTKEAEPQWRSISAGLVVLRLVDRWIAEGPVEATAWNVATVRDAIADIDDTSPQRRILSSVVDAVTNSKTVNVSAVIPRLMAYAQTLEYDARWTLAIDVYRSVISHAHPGDDSDLVAMAFIQLGVSLRNVGDLTAALEACERAQDVANAAGDMIGVLRARIVEAKIAISRGNFPQAESILDDTIDRATGGDLPEVRWRALHDRAMVAGMRGEYDRAIQFAYSALPLASSQRDRDRILGDIATGFLHLGLLDIARDAHLVLMATAQDQYVRWTSALNLMEIAGRQGAETVFNQHRRELASVDFPPYLRGMYLITVGNGYRELGTPELGLPYLHEAVGYASMHGLNHLLFEAEEGLAASRSHTLRAPMHVETAIPAQVAGVAEAIRSMRHLAGVGD